MSFRLLPQAITDIEDIVAYIKADNPSAAERWFDNLYDCFNALAEMPRMGARRSDIGGNVHMFPRGSYIILYNIEADGIAIIRVIHGKRAPESWL